MNYGELKKELKALAFEEESTIEEYIETDIIPTSINRAISMINNDVMPITKKYEIEQDGQDTQYLYYDMSELTDDFLAFGKNPVRIDDGTVYKPFGDYEIDDYSTLVISGAVKGKIAVYYRAEHEAYTADTPDTDEIPLPKRVHYLVPLLAAYFVWLDDDATKAAQYYNAYERESQAVIAETNKPRIRILEGGI